MKLNRLISVVVPIYNDDDIIEEYLSETLKVLHDNFSHSELILVDDGSTEAAQKRTLECLDLYEGVRLIQLSRSFGEDIAIAAGLESAIGDYVVVTLAYLDPPDVIPELVNKCVEGHDIVYGVRSNPNRSRFVYRALASMYYRYCRRILNIDIPADATPLKCFSRRALNALVSINDPSRYLRVFSSMGFKRTAVEYETIQRGKQRKSRNVFGGIRLALGIVFENSAHPLRLVSWLGIFASLANLAYMVYIVAIYLFKENVMPGWTTLSMQNAAQFCFITAILAALAEYVGRILNRLQGRPLYFVMEEYDGKHLLPGQQGWNVVDSVEDEPDASAKIDVFVEHGKT